MSLETAVVALLKTCCPRVFTGAAEAGTARPYIYWQRIGGASTSYLEGALTDLRNAHLQIDTAADSALAADTLAQLIERTLVEAATVQAEALGESQSTHEPELRIYGTTQDFSVWAPR